MELGLHYKANLMEIKSKQENFRLREWKLTDIVSLVKHINNEKIWNNVRDGLPYPYTMLDADKYIRMVTFLEEKEYASGYNYFENPYVST